MALNNISLKEWLKEHGNKDYKYVSRGLVVVTYDGDKNDNRIWDGEFQIKNGKAIALDGTTVPDDMYAKIEEDVAENEFTLANGDVVKKGDPILFVVIKAKTFAKR